MKVKPRKIHVDCVQVFASLDPDLTLFLSIYPSDLFVSLTVYPSISLSIQLSIYL